MTIYENQLIATIKRANCEEKVKRAVNFYSELEAVCRDCIKEQEKYKIVCFISLEEQKRKIKEELEEADRVSYTDLTDDAMILLRCNRCDKEKDVYLICKREKTVEEEKEENKRIIKEALKAVNMTDKEINDILSSFNSSNPNHSRVVGGRERKPCEGRRSTNLPNGWRVELPQEKKVIGMIQEIDEWLAEQEFQEQKKKVEKRTKEWLEEMENEELAKALDIELITV